MIPRYSKYFMLFKIIKRSESNSILWPLPNDMTNKLFHVLKKSELGKVVKEAVVIK